MSYKLQGVNINNVPDYDITALNTSYQLSFIYFYITEVDIQLHINQCEFKFMKKLQYILKLILYTKLMTKVF